MWLRDGDFSAIVSAQGGSVLQWLYRERFILGPARMVRADNGELKARGETHWCFPNFGSIKPEAGYEGPKHGFIRNTLMTAQKRNAATALFLDPATQTEACLRLSDNALCAGIFYRATERMPILPAFHPYFAVPPDGLVVSMGGKPLVSVHEGHPEGVSNKALVLERTGEVKVELYGLGKVDIDLTDEWSHIVLWSDKPSEYICIEPVAGVPGSYGAKEGRWLEPNQQFASVVIMRFKAA
jgi:hypothetical protein